MLSLSTNRAITLLVTYTLNTGLLTTVFTILTLAVFVKTCDTTLLYTPFFFILARLYTCSFMSTLNSRKRIRRAMTKRGAEESYVLSPGVGGSSGQYTNRAVEVFITSTKDTM
ncbi:hypothetical protein AURDEDRAFT_160338 [Auricularia subglabra TFB-10046 SS5]|nr:hypothetical protein AURDEDRAFT_160338 [Auricularia subglabra TFB-10046 SS5]